MTRMIRGSVLLAMCVGLWSCSSDSTSSEAGVPYKIVALPSIVFIKQDSSQLIGFQLVDQLDGQIPTTYTLTSSSPNFTVEMDSSYRAVYNSDGTLTLPDAQTEIRATINGTALGISDFTVTASGISLVIPVNVVPGALYATFSPANPAPGEVVTMTMPPTLRLTPASKISFSVPNKSVGDTNSVRSLTIAADSMSATFIASPIVDTTARVTGVYNVEFPTIPPVTVTTQTKVTGTQSGIWTGNLPGTIAPASSSTTPAAGPITVTLDPVYAFKTVPDSSVYTFPTQTKPIVTSVSADSTVVDLIAGPNVASPLLVTKVTFKGAPQFEYTLASPDSVYTAVITGFSATLSSYTPQIGESVVLTAGAGFSFAGTAIPTWGTAGPGLVQSRTANTMTVQPAPGSSGSPTAVTGVISAAAPLFQLTIPAVLPTPLAMLTTIAALPGTDATGTAPTVAVPPVGQTRGFYDAYSASPQYYKFDVAVTTTLKTTINWSNAADIDVAWYTAAGAFLSYYGAGTGAQPEVSTNQFAPGSYLVGPEVYAGATPAWVSINIEAVSAP